MPALMGLNIVLALVAQISALVFLRLAAPPISQ